MPTTPQRSEQMLHRVGAIDTWERKRLDQAAEHVRADAVKKRARYFAGLQAAVDRMRERGQTLAEIATLVEVDVREIRAALRRARTGDDWQDVARWATLARGTPSTRSADPTRVSTAEIPFRHC